MHLLTPQSRGHALQSASSACAAASFAGMRPSRYEDTAAGVKSSRRKGGARCSLLLLLVVVVVAPCRRHCNHLAPVAAEHSVDSLEISIGI